MKNIYNIILIITIIFNCVSCNDINDLDSYEPQYVLNAEDAIKDPTTAESALTGVYASVHNFGITTSGLIAINEMGITITSKNSSPSEFTINNPNPESLSVSAYYSACYDLINRANWVIEKVSELPDTGFEGDRRLEIVAEARFLRAMFHFYLLRSYGEFYDLSSSYGIVLKTTPSRDSKALPRNTVQESYELILDDLDKAFSNGSASKKSYLVSASLIKAMKAKVLLYMGDFASAATLAKEVIDDDTDIFDLEESYQNIFMDDYNSKEVLFAPFVRNPDQMNINGILYTFEYSASSAFFEVAEESTIIGGFPVPHDNLFFPFSRTNYMRFPLGFFGTKIGKFIMLSPTKPHTNFYLRLAEVYLIYAEAEARSGGNIENALGALNTIRQRGLAMPYPPLVTPEELIELVRIEKIIELSVEGGEEFFDLIRYEKFDTSGTFKVVDHKATASNPYKYIFPIPSTNIKSTNNVVEQNQGY